jgi:hypothetical protein
MFEVDNAMDHFSDQHWVDFVRKVADPATTSDMQRHLDEACPHCSKSHLLWRSVMDKAAQLNDVEPPGASVKAVEAGFKMRKVIAFPAGKLDLAILQFDSDRQLMVAGLRSSGHASARQLLYKSGTVCIDMRMQPTPGSESTLLIGQLLDSMLPGHGIGGIPVSLMSKGNTVSRKQTSPNGEFDFGLKDSTEVQLVFGIGDSRTIVVAVPEREKRVM